MLSYNRIRQNITFKIMAIIGKRVYCRNMKTQENFMIYDKQFKREISERNIIAVNDKNTPSQYLITKIFQKMIF